MRIYLGADHRGFEMKEGLKTWLVDQGYEVEDVGNFIFDPEDDFVDYGVKVSEMVEGGEKENRGILICGSGHGMDIIANRFSHVRAILAFNKEVTVQGREHHDANLLVLAADWVEMEEARERVRMFLETEKMDNTKYERRRSRMSNLQIRQS